MRPILTDTTPAGLRATIVADMTATRLYNNDVPVIAHDEDDVSWATPAPDSEPRGVVTRAAFDEAATERRLDDVLGSFDAATSSVLWWFEPQQRPADLRERLLRRGFRSVGDTAAMAMDLARLPAEEVVVPAGVRIEPVADLPSLDAYVDVLIRNMEIDHPPVAPNAAEIRRRHLAARLGSDPASRRFVAWLDGRPAATSRLSMAGGAAGLYTIVTMPEARGRGIGMAMSLTALRAGREAGMRVAALQATEMGERIYRRIGFRELFRYELLVRSRSAAVAQTR